MLFWASVGQVLFTSSKVVYMLTVYTQFYILIYFIYLSYN